MNLNLNIFAICLIFQREAEKELLHLQGQTCCLSRDGAQDVWKNTSGKISIFSMECLSVYTYASIFCTFDIIGIVDEDFQPQHCTCGV